MKPALIDTDILSMFFRNNQKVVACFKEYLKEHERISLSIVTYYEILSGLKYKNASKQLSAFLEFAKSNAIISLTEDSIAVSSDLYANLRKSGNLIDDIDILIAGIALSNNLVFVTHNENHFKRIEGLEIIDWSR